MLPMLVHHCSACNYNTPIASSASAAEQEQYCNHCGALSHGAPLRVPAISTAAEGQAANMQQQDELSRLFEQNMSFAPAPQPAPTPPPERKPEPQEPPKRPNSEPITYISTHYHHSSHLVPSAARGASPPLSTSSHLDRSDLESILVQHDINPSVLFPSQLALFQYADAEQRQRLLDLWRVCPPTYAEHEKVWESGVWPETSMQQEEAMARLRYERMVAEPQRRGAEDAMMDAAMAPPVQPVSAEPSLLAQRSAEPYMLSGYEALAQREYDEQARLHEAMALQETTRYNQATDPAYYKPVGILEKGGVQDMENQYGAFEAMRQGQGGWGAHMSMADDEMMM